METTCILLLYVDYDIIINCSHTISGNDTTVHLSINTSDSSDPNDIMATKTSLRHQMSKNARQQQMYDDTSLYSI